MQSKRSHTSQQVREARDDEGGGRVGGGVPQAEGKVFHFVMTQAQVCPSQALLWAGAAIYTPCNPNSDPSKMSKLIFIYSIGMIIIINLVIPVERTNSLEHK